jgi:hypothetical protein
VSEEPSESSASPTPEPSPDTPAGEAEEVAVDGEAVSQDELREQLEEEIKKVAVEDVILQSTVSILNLAARRIAKEDERNLEQGKLGIDAVRSMLDYLPEEAQERVREAVSELQMLYAKEAGAEEA